MASMSGADYVLVEAAERCVKTFVLAVMAWAATKGVTLAWSDFIPRKVRENPFWYDAGFAPDGQSAEQPSSLTKGH